MGSCLVETFGLDVKVHIHTVDWSCTHAHTRMLTICTPPECPTKFLARVQDGLQTKVVSAVYQYLLQLNNSGFVISLHLCLHNL